MAATGRGLGSLGRRLRALGLWPISRRRRLIVSAVSSLGWEAQLKKSRIGAMRSRESNPTKVLTLRRGSSRPDLGHKALFERDESHVFGHLLDTTSTCGNHNQRNETRVAPPHSDATLEDRQSITW